MVGVLTFCLKPFLILWFENQQYHSGIGMYIINPIFAIISTLLLHTVGISTSEFSFDPFCFLEERHRVKQSTLPRDREHCRW